MTEDERVGWHHDSMDTSLSKLQEIVKNRKPGRLLFMWSQRVRHNRTTTTRISIMIYINVN